MWLILVYAILSILEIRRFWRNRLYKTEKTVVILGILSLKCVCTLYIFNSIFYITAINITVASQLKIQQIIVGTFAPQFTHFI